MTIEDLRTRLREARAEKNRAEALFSMFDDVVGYLAEQEANRATVPTGDSLLVHPVVKGLPPKKKSKRRK